MKRLGIRYQNGDTKNGTWKHVEQAHSGDWLMSFLLVGGEAIEDKCSSERVLVDRLCNKVTLDDSLHTQTDCLRANTFKHKSECAFI